MTTIVDLGPAARQMIELLHGIADADLGSSTPCERYKLGDIVDHVDGLSLAFTAAASKHVGSGTSQAPSGDASRLSDNWRAEISQSLSMLAQAWREPAAWEGMTQVGGVDLPADIAGRVALNELVIHGWDIARACGQPFEPDAASLAVCWEFLQPVSASEPAEGPEGLFGPVVEVPADAPMLDRVVGLSGRNPSWSPA